MRPDWIFTFFQFFAVTVEISELIVCVLGVFAVVGLQRMRPWGRWLAIALAVVGVASAIRFYSAVLFFWAVDVSSASRMAKRKEHDTTWIRNLHCLLSVAAQDQARVPTAPTFSAGQSEPNL